MKWGAEGLIMVDCLDNTEALHHQLPALPDPGSATPDTLHRAPPSQERSWHERQSVVSKASGPFLGVGEWSCNGFCTPKGLLAAGTTGQTDLEQQPFPNYPGVTETFRVFHKNPRNVAYRHPVSLPPYRTALWWQVATVQNVQQHRPVPQKLCFVHSVLPQNNCQGKRQRHISATCR